MTHSRIFPSLKHRKNYALYRHLNVSEMGLNETRKMFKISKPDSKYYVKQPDFPEIEVVAKELARLICPWQPKTRLMTDASGDLYVLSKEVKNFQSFGLTVLDELSAHLSQNLLIGLGFACINALVTNDYDLNNGNIGFDPETGRIISIDGDRAFYRCHVYEKDFDDKSVEITHQSIETQPSGEFTGAYNWLHSVAKLKLINSASYITDLQHNKAFQLELNLAILYWLLLPSYVLDEFISFYCINQSISTLLKKEIKDRIEQLHDAAMQIDSFKAYLNSEDANLESIRFTNQVQNFKLVKKIRLTTANSFQTDIQNRLALLRATSTSKARLKSPPVRFNTKINSVDDILSCLPNMVITDFPYFHRKLHELSDYERAFFSELNRFLLINKIATPDINRIINSAAQQNVACFDDLYSFLSTYSTYKTRHTNKIIPLGFFNDLVSYFKVLSDPKSSDVSIITSCMRIEQFIATYRHFFFEDPATERHYLSVSSMVGRLIHWNEYIKPPETAFKYQHIPIVAKVLLRLGFAADVKLLDRLSLTDIRDVIQSQVCFLPYVTYRGVRTNSIGLLDTDFLFVEISRRDASANPSIKSITRESIENFISDNEYYLAYAELSPLISSAFINAVRELSKQDHKVAFEFLYDFFCNPDYKLGMYHLRGVRSSLCPFIMSHNRIFHHYEGSRKFVNFSNDLSNNNLMRLFIEFFDKIQFYHAIDIMNAHFSVEMIPLCLLEKPNSPYENSLKDCDWGPLVCNVLDDMQLPARLRRFLAIQAIGSGKISTFNIHITHYYPLLEYYLEHFEHKTDEITFNMLQYLYHVLLNSRISTDFNPVLSSIIDKLAGTTQVNSHPELITAVHKAVHDATVKNQSSNGDNTSASDHSTPSSFGLSIFSPSNTVSSPDIKSLLNASIDETSSLNVKL